METTKHVYVIGQHDVEGASVRFVCTTKEIATERFESVRKELFEGYERRSKGKYGFIDKRYRNVLKNITLENSDLPEMYSIHEIPYYIKVKLNAEKD